MIMATNIVLKHLMTNAEMFYLVDVGMPHLSEEAEGRWGVRVVNWELDVCLAEQTEVDSQHMFYRQTSLTCHTRFKSFGPVGLSLRGKRHPGRSCVDVLEVSAAD